MAATQDYANFVEANDLYNGHWKPNEQWEAERKQRDINWHEWLLRL